MLPTGDKRAPGLGSYIKDELGSYVTLIVSATHPLRVVALRDCAATSAVAPLIEQREPRGRACVVVHRAERETKEIDPGERLQGGIRQIRSEHDLDARTGLQTRQGQKGDHDRDDADERQRRDDPRRPHHESLRPRPEQRVWGSKTPTISPMSPEKPCAPVSLSITPRSDWIGSGPFDPGQCRKMSQSHY
jgi:hypothetical protein